MESDSIPVVARELGNNISRIKILKPETRVIKRRGKEEPAAVTVVDDYVEPSSAEDLSLLAEEAKQSDEEDKVEERAEEEEEDGEDEITYFAEAPVEAESEMDVDVEVEVEEVSLSGTEELTDRAADTPPVCPGKAIAACAHTFTFPSTDPGSASVLLAGVCGEEYSSEPTLTVISKSADVYRMAYSIDTESYSIFHQM